MGIMRIDTRRKFPNTPAGKREFILRIMFMGARVHNIGNSKAVILPAMWVRIFAEKFDGKSWVTLRSEPGRLIIGSIDTRKTEPSIGQNTALRNMGGSNAVILPADLVRIFEADGKSWVTLTSGPGVLIIKGIDENKAKALMKHNKVGV